MEERERKRERERARKREGGSEREGERYHSIALVFGVFYERRDKLCALFKLLASAIEVAFIRQLRSYTPLNKCMYV